MHDGVHLADVGQEFVPQTLPLAGARHQAGNVHELHPGGDQLAAAAQLGQLVQARVWNRHHPGVGLDGAEGIVGRLRLGVGHQGVEQG